MFRSNKHITKKLLISLNIFNNRFIVNISTNLKKTFFSLALIIFCISNVFAQNNESLKIKTLVIDPGHGGFDPGAVGKKSKEKDLALKISLKLGHYIETRIPGVKVIYTRKSDVFVSLERRVEIANSNDADIFISVHVNSNESDRPYGTSSYVMGVNDTKRNMNVAIKENSVIKLEENYATIYEGFDPNNPESYIMFSLLQDTFQKQSLRIASIIQDQFRIGAGRRDHGVMQQPIYVLWKTAMPSVLVETGFVSNAIEENFLMTDLGQDYLASAIFRAFRSYKNEIESNNIINERVEEEENSDIVTATNEDIFFCVQILSSLKKIPINSAIFKGQKDVVERKVNNSYKYTVGRSTSFNDIINKQRELKILFTGAFITAYNNGVRISNSEAKEKLNIK
ncbi:N-acetylmuramoyl-L-alanine amidase [Bacteroidota bacterium]